MQTRGVARWATVAWFLGLAIAACGGNDGNGSSGSSQPASSTAVTVVSSDGTTSTSIVPATATDVSSTAPTTTSTVASEPDVAIWPLRAGAQRIHYEVGPIEVKGGQNNISFTGAGIPKPDADGFIVRIAPDLRLGDGSIPPVDVIHLHHGVWLNASAQDATRPGISERFFAAGEEKTVSQVPDGYGYRVARADRWVLNYMIHNLWPETQPVWITYDVDFIPAASSEAVDIVPVRPIWTDVQNGSVYPVFDVHSGTGTGGEFVYPDQQPDAYAADAPANEWTVDRDGVLVGTAGHLHPGGLHTDLWLRRDGSVAPVDAAKPGSPDTTHLFRSVANYYEPAGAVSWDVSMTSTTPDWRVAVRRGDVVSTNATYDSARASWYESMGIMVVWMADTQPAGEASAPDPFVTPVDAPGALTHGHLKENDNHGGADAPEYRNLTQVPAGPLTAAIPIERYQYAQGDMLVADSVPTVARGQSITFENRDAPLDNGVWHTVTACKAPCNKTTGVAYPLADGDISFDSGQLGDAGPPTAGEVSWQTPGDLPTGLYTYFCRIHPFMRGGFEVVDG
jgi:plastocyanin